MYEIPYHPLNALNSKTKKGINICSFMVSTYQMYISGILNLQYSQNNA